MHRHRWLQSRKQDDNAEGLWRVHDTLYDLSGFIDWHPGGGDWIKLTKVPNKMTKIPLNEMNKKTFVYDLQGTDITEAFEVHHINYAKVKHLLQDYRVRDAKLSRNFKFTFKETGFYRTMRRRVGEKLKTLNLKQAEFMTKVYVFFFV